MRVGTWKEFLSKKKKKAYKTFLASRSDASWLDTVAVAFPKGRWSGLPVHPQVQPVAAAKRLLLRMKQKQEPGRALRAVAF